MKKHTAYILFLALPLSALLFLLYCLETYTGHTDTAFYVVLYCALALAVSAFVWHRSKASVPYATAFWLMAATVLILTLCTAFKIPFCTVCDNTTAEELGFLIHWIPLDTPH